MLFPYCPSSWRSGRKASLDESLISPDQLTNAFGYGTGCKSTMKNFEDQSWATNLLRTRVRRTGQVKTRCSSYGRGVVVQFHFSAPTINAAFIGPHWATLSYSTNISQATVCISDCIDFHYYVVTSPKFMEWPSSSALSSIRATVINSLLIQWPTSLMFQVFILKRLRNFPAMHFYRLKYPRTLALTLQNFDTG